MCVGQPCVSRCAVVRREAALRSAVGPEGMVGRSGTRAPGGLAVPKCALAADGCAPCRTVSADVLLQLFHC